MTQVLGIDPAPKKPTAVWTDDRAVRVEAGEVRVFIEERLRVSRGLLVVWDSPLTFDPADGFSHRPFDRAVGAWVREKVRMGTIEPKAVSVRPFSGCPHWTISCHALGLPFGQRIDGLIPYSTPFEEPAPGSGIVVESHPAVALAALWVDRGFDEPLPRYKGSRDLAGVPAGIAARLGFPEAAGEDDDTLDAYLSYQLGVDLLAGRARLVGDPERGGYLLPDGPAAKEIEDLFRAL